MRFRKALFWSHLIAGVAAGVFVLILSVTGVIATYEHEIVDMFARNDTVAIPGDDATLSVDDLVEIAKPRSQGTRPIMLAFENRERAPVSIHVIGLEEFQVSPYSGEEFDSDTSRVQSFFETVIELHRWLGMREDGRTVGRNITGAANLALLFLLASGIYLWLPKVWKWAFFRMNMVFGRSMATSKARDYNWHHVFGFWALIPLFLIVFSGVVISYSWANGLFFRAFGEDPPVQAGPPILADLQLDAALGGSGADPTQLATLQDAFDAAKATDENWTKIYLMVPARPDVPIVRLIVNNGDGVLPTQQQTVVFDRSVGDIVETLRYDDMRTVEKARMWIRFVHTGEQYGIVGSTIAGLASLAACFLIYTGFALAYRRLIQPLLARQGRG